MVAAPDTNAYHTLSPPDMERLRHQFVPDSDLNFEKLKISLTSTSALLYQNHSHIHLPLQTRPATLLYLLALYQHFSSVNGSVAKMPVGRKTLNKHKRFQKAEKAAAAAARNPEPTDKASWILKFFNDKLPALQKKVITIKHHCGRKDAATAHAKQESCVTDKHIGWCPACGQLFKYLNGCNKHKIKKEELIFSTSEYCELWAHQEYAKSFLNEHVGDEDGVEGN